MEEGLRSGRAGRSRGKGDGVSKGGSPGEEGVKMVVRKRPRLILSGSEESEDENLLVREGRSGKLGCVRNDGNKLEEATGVRKKSKIGDVLKPCNKNKIGGDEKNSSPKNDKKVSRSADFSNGNSKRKDATLESYASKKGEVKVSTEKQLIRERIKQMLLSAGWKIDLRKRSSRDYYDSVYVSTKGIEYWSVTKAYYAFEKTSRNSSSFTPIPEDVISKLTRNTTRKMEREMKMQKKAEMKMQKKTDKTSKKAKETSEQKPKSNYLKKITDSDVSDENKIPHGTHDGKSLKARKVNNVLGLNTNDHSKNTKSTLRKAICGNGENNKQRGRGLLVRSSGRGVNMASDGYIPYAGKRTVLSWMVDMKTVRSGKEVQYMDKKRTQVMLEGWIMRDGIHCSCCSRALTVSEFELHAGGKQCRPFHNIFIKGGVSLYQCLLNAWKRLDKSVRDGFNFIDITVDDPNDDTCGICGDGGDLICCDGCPSTFHQSCLDIQMLPSGDWFCSNCSCKYCHGVDGGTGQEEDKTLCSCRLCEKKFHQLCRQPANSTISDSDSANISFCGKTCEELFQQLLKFVGVKHEMEEGFSWTLIQCSSLDSNESSLGQWQKEECNSKIAVALTIMNECFLPLIDQRSGVNLIHNVVFNIGSNFNRLNYSGFYTVVLERGDEIISAASIRIRGTNVAEMPFIGTRHIYRRQGMCRRLLRAIESVLCALNIEKLVIPAISELMHTWTTVFGFKSLEESHRREVKTWNLLVFPSTDLLQKPLRKHQSNEVDVAVLKAIVPNGNSHIMCEKSENSDTGYVDPETCAPAAVCEGKKHGVSVTEIGPRSFGGSTYDSV